MAQFIFNTSEHLRANDSSGICALFNQWLSLPDAIITELERALAHANIDGLKLCSLGNSDSIADFFRSNYNFTCMYRMTEDQIRIVCFGLVQTYPYAIRCCHPFVKKMSGNYKCMDCQSSDVLASDSARAEQITAEMNTCAAEQDIRSRRPGMSPGELSSCRGVPIGWLRDWTTRHNCYHMTTANVVRLFIIPATAETRCRYIELPELQAADIAGPAHTFVSHCWGACWGDLVAAAADGGADPNRRVWIDVFAVRQWPCDVPDLDFAGTIAHCPSFLLVCSSLPEVLSMSDEDIVARNVGALSAATRHKIAFCRVWCLVEVNAAVTRAEQDEVPIVMKAGSHRYVQDSGHVEFISNVEMLRSMLQMIDIRYADATVAEDRMRILQGVEGQEGGFDRLNSKVRGAIAGGIACSYNPSIACAACGDREALALTMHAQLSVVYAAGAGFTMLLRKLLEAGANPNETDSDASSRSALMAAAAGGHTSCVEELLRRGVHVNRADDNGVTPLMCAAAGGHVDVLDILLRSNSIDVNATTAAAWTALMFAASAGHVACVEALIRGGADVAVEDSNGSSALRCAASGRHVKVVETLIEAGASFVTPGLSAADFEVGALILTTAWHVVYIATRISDGRRFSLKVRGYARFMNDMAPLHKEIALLLCLQGMSCVVQLEGVFMDTPEGLFPNRRSEQAYPILVEEYVEGGDLFDSVSNTVGNGQARNEGNIAAIYRSAFKALLRLNDRRLLTRYDIVDVDIMTIIYIV
jgi:uncharacterized protein